MVGDVVYLRPDVEMHRPPRRYVVEAVNGPDVRLSVLADDVCGYCAAVDGLDAGWFNAGVIGTPELQGALW